jgi:hypothetical protein
MELYVHPVRWSKFFSKEMLVIGIAHFQKVKDENLDGLSKILSKMSRPP